METKPRGAGMSIYDDDAQVGALTRRLIALGFPILQSHKLGDSDGDHVAALLRHFDPPPGAHVLDAGCGAGAVAALMQRQRPDLNFTLLNFSYAQLAIATVNPAMPKVCGDFHQLPFAPCSFDCVMFTYSLGHASVPHLVFNEAWHALRPGGVLFIYDIAADKPDDFLEPMGYRPHRPAEVKAWASRAGFRAPKVWDNPPSSSADMLEIFGAEVFKAHGFDRVRPVLYRFTAL